MNPISTPIIPNTLLLFSCILGTNSSITTYIIAPEAKDNKYGNNGTTKFNKNIVKKALIGSTIPDNTPAINDLNLLFPSIWSGIDIIAPSGMFWSAIPIDNIIELIKVDVESKYAAKDTPTAIPSGILCKVTLNNDNVQIKILLEYKKN